MARAGSSGGGSRIGPLVLRSVEVEWGMLLGPHSPPPAPSAFAGAPTATILPNQGVEGTVSVTLAPADVRARLADPTWVSTIDAGSTTVTVRERAGDCLIADFTSPSTLMTVRYTVRQCPTANGYKSTLVSSDDFASYEAEWSVAAEGTGSLLTYRLRLTPSLPIPASFLSGTLRRDILSLMEQFAGRFGA